MVQQNTCHRCGVRLKADEIGATKKFINRGTDRFYCLDCLSRAFEVGREDLERKILEFKANGCTLFS